MSGRVLSIIAIIALGFITYSNTFYSSFHFDDDLYIINDYAIRNIHHLADIWKLCPCRFITFLSISLNYHYHQLNVFGYHLFNIIVHLGTACLVWWLTKLTFSTPVLLEETAKTKNLKYSLSMIALFAGLIFVSHPVQSQAVTYIWQRTASLAAFFYLASLCFYAKSRLLQDKKINTSKAYFIFSLMTAVLAMFTKENTITLPLMVLLYEFNFFKHKKDFDWNQLYPFWIILFIIPLTMSLTNSARFQEIQSIVGGPGGISPIDYLITQFRVMFTYIRLLFLPIHLNLDYDYPIYKSFFEIPVLSSFIGLAAILYFAKRMFAQYRLISFSIFWFFLTLLPESSIIPQEDVIFEHRLYLPLVGYALFLASVTFYLIGNKNIKTMIIVLSLIIGINSFLTYQRNKTWKDEITLWGDNVKKSPYKARAYNNLGWAYYNQGDYKTAMHNFNKALSLNPQYFFSYNDRGLILYKEGKYNQAVIEFNQAIQINPYYANFYYDRAMAYIKLDNKTQALADFNKAIELNPDYLDAYTDRAKLKEIENAR